jgi:C4-type Zn-finger protein
MARKAKIIKVKDRCPYCRSDEERRMHVEYNKIGYDRVVEDWYICSKCGRRVLYQKPEYSNKRVLW